MTDGSPGAPQQKLPDQVTMGLLAYLNAHALDEDYRIAAQRSHPGESPHQRRPIGRYGAAALALFAVFGVTAAVQTSRNEATDERERRDLIAEIESRDADLAEDRDTIRELQAETSKLETQLLRRDDSATAVLDELVLLGVRNGATAVRGPGVRVTVDDAPGGVEDERLRVLDTDLQQLVNGLWQAGAEAITVNRERLTNLSAIRHAGSAITVNFRSISRPYVVEAIGNPDELPARFGETSSGQTWLDLQQSVGLEFNMQVDRSLRLPGVNIRAAPLRRTRDRRREERPVIAILGLVLGVAVGLFLKPDVPLALEPYLPIAVVAALDAVFGAMRAFLDGIFDDKVFVISFISNVLIAALIVFVGDKLGVGAQLSTGVIVVLGIRIFANVAAIRRHLFHA